MKKICLAFGFLVLMIHCESQPIETQLKKGWQQLKKDSIFRHAIAAVEIHGRVSGLDLFKSFAICDQIGDTVANHGDHIPIANNIRLIADSAVAGNDVGATLLLPLGDAEFDDVVEGCQNALKRAAIFPINYRICHS